MLRKFFLVLLCLAVVLTKADPLFAQSNILKDKQDAIEKGTNQESWLNEAMSSNLVSTLQVLTGPIPDEVIAGQAISWIPGGALGGATNLIASLYGPPASGIQYLADLWNNKFLSKPAYAQGIGFKGLQPILPIWRSFRNMIYLFSSVIFVVIGIMIILRVKISPQAVVTIQNAIPQLITTLILVTFSYAIAGLLIDISQFIQAFGVALVAPGLLSGTNIFSRIAVILSNTPILRAITPNFASLSNPNYGTLAWLMALPGALIFASGTMYSFIIGAVIGLVSLNPLLGLGIGAGGGILIAVILAICVLVWTIKFLMGLFKCYTTVLFKIILAPLEIGIGAFPNSKMGFSSWFVGLIAHLSVFPFSLLFLVLSNYIIITILSSNINLNLLDILKGNLFVTNGLWTPSLLGGDVTGLGLNRFGGIAVMAIAVSTLLILSKLPDLIPQVIFQLKPSPFSQAVSMKDIPFLSPLGTVAKGTAASYAAREIFDERGGAAKTKLGAKLRNVIETRTGGGQEVTSAISEGIKSLGRH